MNLQENLKSTDKVLYSLVQSKNKHLWYVLEQLPDYNPQEAQPEPNERKIVHVNVNKHKANLHLNSLTNL